MYRLYSGVMNKTSWAGKHLEGEVLFFGGVYEVQVEVVSDRVGMLQRLGHLDQVRYLLLQHAHHLGERNKKTETRHNGNNTPTNTTSYDSRELRIYVEQEKYTARGEATLLNRQVARKGYYLYRGFPRCRGRTLNTSISSRALLADVCGGLIYSHTF